MGTGFVGVLWRHTGSRLQDSEDTASTHGIAGSSCTAERQSVSSIPALSQLGRMKTETRGLPRVATIGSSGASVRHS